MNLSEEPETIESPGEAPGISCTVATSAVQAQALRGGWEALVDRLGKGSLDCDPEFLLRTHQAVDTASKPYIALLQRDGNHPCGLIVGRATTRRIPCRVGYLQLKTPSLRCLDVVYGGLLADPDAEAQRRVIECIREQLVSGRFDCVSVHHLSLEDPLWGDLAAGAGIGRRALFRPEHHWYSELFDSETGAPVQHFSGKRRRKLRWMDNKLRQAFDGKVELAPYTGPGQVGQFIENAVAIAREGYQGAMGIGVENTPRWQTILSVLADSGRLRGYLLLACGSPIAYALGAVHRRTFFLLATAFVPTYHDLQPGGFLIRRLLEEIAEEKVQRVDFGFGDADYKRLYGTESRMEATIQLHGRGLRATFARGLEASAMTTSRWLKQVAVTSGVVNSIRKAWRARLQRKDRKKGATSRTQRLPNPEAERRQKREQDERWEDPKSRGSGH